MGVAEGEDAVGSQMALQISETCNNTLCIYVPYFLE